MSPNAVSGQSHHSRRHFRVDSRRDGRFPVVIPRINVSGPIRLDIDRPRSAYSFTQHVYGANDRPPSWSGRASAFLAVGVIDSVLWYKSFTIIYADFEAG